MHKMLFGMTDHNKWMPIVHDIVEQLCDRCCDPSACYVLVQANEHIGNVDPYCTMDPADGRTSSPVVKISKNSSIFV